MGIYQTVVIMYAAFLLAILPLTVSAAVYERASCTTEGGPLTKIENGVKATGADFPDEDGKWSAGHCETRCLEVADCSVYFYEREKGSKKCFLYQSGDIVNKWPADPRDVLIYAGRCE